METTSQPEANSAATPPGERRGFLVKFAAGAIGAIVVLFPFAAGLGTFLHPLRRRENGGKKEFIQLTTLDALPADGTPTKVTVVADRDDAWSRSREPVGAVYVRRTGEKSVQAFTATCPHAGCFVAFSESTDTFICPCHNSSFAIDGAMIQPTPSPRPLDELAAEVRNENEVWVNFQIFRAGIEQKVPKQA